MPLRQAEPGRKCQLLSMHHGERQLRAVASGDFHNPGWPKLLLRSPGILAGILAACFPNENPLSQLTLWHSGRITSLLRDLSDDSSSCLCMLLWEPSFWWLWLTSCLRAGYPRKGAETQAFACCCLWSQLDPPWASHCTGPIGFSLILTLEEAFLLQMASHVEVISLEERWRTFCKWEALTFCFRFQMCGFRSQISDQYYWLLKVKFKYKSHWKSLLILLLGYVIFYKHKDLSQKDARMILVFLSI